MNGIPEHELNCLSREKAHIPAKINTKKVLTRTRKTETLTPMINYYIKPNGTGTAYMVTCDTEQEAQGELWSLQNKGVATDAEIVSPTSFVFFASQKRLFKAFVLQFICKNWLDAESCKLYKGEKGGFYADAKKYASEKFAKMSNANWIFKQRSVPEIYTSGKISAEKDSGDWKDTLTSVLQSV